MSPTRLLSQLGHIEMYSPRPDASLRFFVDVMGMEHTETVGQTAYLRCWAEWFHHSVAITEAPDPAIGHFGWRSDGPEALEEAVRRILATGLGEGWYEDSVGHGPAYRYRSPAGHLQEVYWEADRYVAPPELASRFPNRPQRNPFRGANVRHLDHVTVMAGDLMGNVEWHRDTLGYRFTEWTALDENPDVPFFATITTNEKAHDFGIMADLSGTPGRVHHFAFWLDETADVHRAADAIVELGGTLEYGPGRHGMGENTFLYLREPGGMRIELFSGGYRNYLPDWEPIKWTPSQGSSDMYRNHPMPDAMLEAFPRGDWRFPEGVPNPWAVGIS